VSSKTELGKRCEAIMASGALVDDATMADVVRSRVRQADCGPGFILDGYPRNREQAETLDAILRETGCAVDAALFLDVPQEELVRRMTGRREQAGRADDREEVVRERLRIYQEKTSPLVQYYEQRGLLRHINGNQPVEKVAQAIDAAIHGNDSGAHTARRAG